MRYSKNKRNHKKRRTRTRYAGQFINSLENAAQSAAQRGENSVKNAAQSAENAAQSAAQSAKNAAQKGVSSAENSFNSFKMGGRKTKKCRQRGGNALANTMGKLGEQIAGWRQSLGPLKEALQEGINKAEALTPLHPPPLEPPHPPCRPPYCKLPPPPSSPPLHPNPPLKPSPPLQNGGKRKKKRHTKGGQNNEMFENEDQINKANEFTESATANKVEEQAPVNKVEEQAPVNKGEPEVTMDNTEKLPEAEVEKECTGFLDKIFGCKTKAQKLQESKLKECIEKCKAPKESETKQQGGKTKKLKKRKKRNSRKKKNSRKR